MVKITYKSTPFACHVTRRCPEANKNCRILNSGDKYCTRHHVQGMSYTLPSVVLIESFRYHSYTITEEVLPDIIYFHSPKEVCTLYSTAIYHIRLPEDMKKYSIIYCFMVRYSQISYVYGYLKR